MITLNSGLAEQGDWGIEDNILFDEMQFFSCLRFHGVFCFILVYILDDNSNKILIFGKGNFKMRGFVRKYKCRKGLSLNRRGIHFHMLKYKSSRNTPVETKGKIHH
eukprot:TRINITY_DN33951_c2_g1_i1.p1 TRINITY_DN33951_c2_g1~~TRINITY_DN33951_c2_g1_i1.p1  ORF type:complete len:106 (+),score=4.87 TRINITY_DN33951_c2_g1_i1:150-467(+)